MISSNGEAFTQQNATLYKLFWLGPVKKFLIQLVLSKGQKKKASSSLHSVIDVSFCRELMISRTSSCDLCNCSLAACSAGATFPSGQVNHDRR